MKILLPTDGSAYSDAAAGFLLRLGLGPGDEITVLHVVKDYLVPDVLNGAKEFRAAGTRGARALVKDFRERSLPLDFSVRTLVREGEPWEEISACAGETGAELIAMGHRGLSGVKRFMLGSLVNKVVRRSTVPVLVVRDAPPAGRPLRVLFCSGGTGSSDRARDLLAGLPLDSDTEVTDVSVVDMELTSMPEQYYPEEDISRMTARLREYLAKAAQEAVDKDSEALGKRFGRVRTEVLFGEPDREILNAATGANADLVVMGCRENRGVAGALLGSASYRVLKHIGCSMLIAKSPLC